MTDDATTTAGAGLEQVPTLTSLGETAVDLTLGVLAVGRGRPARGARSRRQAARRWLAQREVDQLLVRGARGARRR